MGVKFKGQWWHQPRVWRWGGQAGVVLLVVLAALYLGTNLTQNLQRLNLQLGFDFLQSQAGFGIGETSVDYRPTDPYAWALWVGLLNSLRVMGAGLVLTTIVGITIGVARLSDNWLVRQLALIYVETLRNTPLLLQLLFWYFALFLGLPPLSDRLQLPGPIYLSNQGISLPWPQATAATLIWAIVLGIGGAIAFSLWRRLTQRQIEQGQAGQLILWPWVALTIAVGLAGALTRRGPWVWDLPQVVNNTQVQGGLQLSSEFATLLLGLTLYTAAFIAEIVRAGITAVAKGQWEAARALGLKSSTTLRLVVFPQALRVIVPPLTSQYLNLAKNSSLAIAIGYPDVYAVASTTFNQTGKAVEVLLLLMVTYLTISLLIALVMNWYNRRIQLVER